MLWVVSMLLAIVWLVAWFTTGALGGFIHILLVLSLAVLVIQLTMGRRAV
ncbi:MAG: lmo0937 family membrane protein [Bryobacteraceae bacterium]|jgi:hypothetical protein